MTFTSSPLDQKWVTYSWKGIPIASGTSEQYINFIKNWASPIYNMPRRFRGFRAGSRSRKRRRVIPPITSGYKRLGAPRKGFTSGRGVTREHDRQHIYRKRRMPWRKRRRWVRQIRRWNRISEKQLGSRTVVFNVSNDYENSTSGNQIVTTLGLYGWDSTNTYLNDLNAIAAYENEGDPTAAAGVTINDTAKFMFTSGVLDMTIRNTSHLFETPSTIEADATLEVDIYEITMGRQAVNTESTTLARFVQLTEVFDTIGNNETNVLGSIVTGKQV